MFFYSHAVKTSMENTLVDWSNIIEGNKDMRQLFFAILLRLLVSLSYTRILWNKAKPSALVKPFLATKPRTAKRV